MLVEICVDSLKSAKAAAKGGANRIELCSALKLGGLTPTTGLLKAIKRDPEIRIDIYCMIRPRGGDFIYDEYEMETILEDINVLKEFGADGFVFGALTNDCKLDQEKCRRIVEACHPKAVTLHRAFDYVSSSEWRNAVDSAVALGFKCILTSGLHANVVAGLENLKQIVEHAGNRIIIMAGSGVTPESVPLLKSSIPQLKAIHGSASIQRKSLCEAHTQPSFTMGSDDSQHNEKETSDEIVRKIVHIVNC